MIESEYQAGKRLTRESKELRIDPDRLLDYQVEADGFVTTVPFRDDCLARRWAIQNGIVESIFRGDTPVYRNPNKAV